MDFPLTAIAIDDEPKALEIIERYAEKISFLTLLHTFRDPLDAVNWLSAESVDVLFLDINMPNLSGLAFRRLIGRDPMIIFTTAYSEYAVESYEYNALDYLLKPISFDRFFAAVMKAKGTVQKSERKIVHTPETSRQIFIKSGSKLYRFAPEEVLFCEKDGNYCLVHTSDKKILSRLNMAQLLEILPSNTFLRVHKSYVINLDHVAVIESHQLTIGKHCIPIAKSYRELVKNRLGNP